MAQSTPPNATPETLAAHGAQIPRLGLGTGSLPKECGPLIAHALQVGFRHIDTAQKYGTEKGVGEGIRASGVPRADIFLTTKVSHEYLRAADFERTAEGCLETLGVDYVDLLLIHWPNPEIPLPGTMQALARVKNRGLTRHIGVANFNLALLDQAIALCPEPLVTLQTEFHPYVYPRKVLEGVLARGMVLTGYCPLGRGRLLDDPVLGEIAKTRGLTPAQVALRWSLQKPGVIPIPRSSNSARIAANFDVFGFTLTEDEMQRIDALQRPAGRIANPAGRSPQWDD